MGTLLRISSDIESVIWKFRYSNTEKIVYYLPTYLPAHLPNILVNRYFYH